MKYRKILIFSLVVVGMFCVLGLFARPCPNDEYGYHNTVARLGIAESIVHHYHNTNGRITNNLLMDLFTSFRLEKIQPFMPFITVITYILAVFSLLGTLVPSLKPREKFSLSCLMCALTLCFTYSLQETFYWLPGMPYFWAGTLLVLALSLAVKAFRGSRLSFVLCVIVLFLNATNLEQPCVFQGIVAFLAMLFFLWRGDRKRAVTAGTFWLVSVAGFCLMYFAPSTALRLLSFNAVQRPLLARVLRGFMAACSLGVLNTLQFFAKPLVYSVLFFVPAFAAKIPPADKTLSRKLRAWHIVAVMFAISMFMQFMMGVIGEGKMLPDRGVSISLWFMGFTWALFWACFYRGRLAQSEGFSGVCAKLRWPVLILSVLVSANFTDCISAFRVAPQFAAEWENRVDLILAQREEGATNLRVPPLKTKPGLIFSDVIAEVNPNWSWTGGPFARYYGADNLHLIPEGLSGNPEDVSKLMSGDLEPYSKLAESGDTDAMFIMGYYEDSEYSAKAKESKSVDEALRWYTMGAEAGDLRCMKYLARSLLRRNLRDAVYWLTKYHVLTTRL